MTGYDSLVNKIRELAQFPGLQDCKAYLDCFVLMLRSVSEPHTAPWIA